MIPANILHDNLLLLAHHVDDAQEALEEGDDAVIEDSLTDMKEIIEELVSYLPKNLAIELEAQEMGLSSRVEEIARNMLD